MFVEAAFHCREQKPQNSKKGKRLAGSEEKRRLNLPQERTEND